ncbi:MAG: hypothetical protein ACI9Y1_003682, partial [Lentisphaeria bacterium]
MSSHYCEEHEEKMANFYDSLSERIVDVMQPLRRRKLDIEVPHIFVRYLAVMTKRLKKACWIFMMKKHFSRRVSEHPE